MVTPANECATTPRIHSLPDRQRGKVPWRKGLQLLLINRLCDPGSEFAVHRRWFLRSCDEAQRRRHRLDAAGGA